MSYVGKASIAFAKQIMRFVRRHAADDMRVIYTATTVGSYLGLKHASPHLITPTVVNKFTCLSDLDANYISVIETIVGRIS